MGSEGLHLHEPRARLSSRRRLARLREIEPDKRIVLTFAWEGGRDQPGVDTLVTVTFTEKDGRTIQSFHQAPFIHIEGRDSHIQGWNSAFDKEQAYTQGLYRGPS